MLAVALVGACAAGGGAAAPDAKAPRWLQTLTARYAAGLGDASPRSTTFRFRPSSVTVVMHGRFACTPPRCPFPVTGGPRGGPHRPIRGSIFTALIRLPSRLPVHLSLTYPRLSVGPGSHPPPRTDIVFAEAMEGPRSAFSSAPETSARARRIVFFWLNRREHHHVLLVAPTAAGGFCTSLTGAYGRTGCSAAGARRGPGLHAGMTGDAGGPILFDGYFAGVSGARLEVTYEDGGRETVPFAWVGSPIRVGFFVLDLTRHRKAGHRPAVLTLYGGQGQPLLRRRLG